MSGALSLEALLQRDPPGSTGLRRFGELLAHQPRRDYLDAIDSERRVLRLRLTSELLLRKAERSNRQTRTMADLREVLRGQVREQMRGRRPFRRPVSVEIDLHATGMAQPPASPPSVKAYLDLLGKRGEPPLVYADDECVHHLRVRRHASDHPIARAEPEDWIHMDRPRLPWGPDQGVEVAITVRPLRTYIADYDRLFRRREQIFGEDLRRHRWDDDDDRVGAGFWKEDWDDLHDDDRLRELRSEDADDRANRGLYAPGGLYDGWAHGQEMRMSERRRRVREIKVLLDKLILDQRPRKLDPPGPVSEIDVLSWAAVPELLAMTRAHPITTGVFYLPLPPEASGELAWRQTVRTVMTAHQRKVRILERPFDTPLSLDISVRGAGRGRRDLDNIAHDVLIPFEEVFCADRRGTVVSYRAYLADSDEPGVRVMVLADHRSHDMEDAIKASRDWVLANGPAHLRAFH